MASRVPLQVDDGYMFLELEEGVDISFPLSNKGDFGHFIYRKKYSIDKLAFRTLPSMSRLSLPMGVGYLVEQGDAKDIGHGLCEYERAYASIPATRTEVKVMSFSFTLVTFVGLETILKTYTLTNSAEVLIEYFDQKPEPILAQTLFFGSPPPNIVCQDSDIDIYMGGIWVRQSYRANVIGSKINL